MGSARRRPLRGARERAASRILCVGQRPRGMRRRRVLDVVDTDERVDQPALCTDRADSAEDTGRSGHSNLAVPSLAGSGMVSDASGDDLRLPPDSSAGSRHVLARRRDLGAPSPTHLGTHRGSRLRFVQECSSLPPAALEWAFRSWRNPAGYDSAWANSQPSRRDLAIVQRVFRPT